jgi:hypothetical protein
MRSRLRSLLCWWLLPLATAVSAVASSCAAPPPPLALHNLERPTDMVFSCVGLLPDPDMGGTQVVSGRPMPECHAPGRFDAPFDQTRRTFGFVTNTARGELSVVDMDASNLVDLDPSNPDTNVSLLGVLPGQIDASQDGCRIVSANSGSCDLTMVDVGALMSPTLIRQDKSAATPVTPTESSQQVVVVTGDGRPLHVAPQEILFLPQDTSTLIDAPSGQPAICGQKPTAQPATGGRTPTALPIGWTDAYTGTAGAGWKAVVSFPSCNLVALVDVPWSATGHLATATIVDSVQMIASSDGTSIQLHNTGANPTCAQVDFCDSRWQDTEVTADGGTSDAGSNDAGTSDASSLTGDPATFAHDPFINPTGVRPGPLAIRPQGDRVYVGLGQAAYVIALDLRAGQLVIPPGAQIQLHEGARGVDRVRLSVDPYKATGIPGQYGGFVGEGPLRDRQFLYAIARDGSVRIVDVSRSARLLPEIECDANIDPATPASAVDLSQPCQPASPPSPYRKPFANGPGIRLPAVPRDVTAVDLTSNDPRNNWEGVLDGSYAFVLTSSGGIYIVNIAPTLRTKTLANITTGIAVDAPVPEAAPLVNSLRDHNQLTYVTNQDPTLGQPRLDTPPTVPPEGPPILAIKTSSPLDSPIATVCPDGLGDCTSVFFPHRTSVQRQTWTVTWEGNFVGPSFSGQLSKIDPANQVMELDDLAVGFCSAGVLPGDFVTLFGCTADTQCGPEQNCVRSDTAPQAVGTVPINGLCMPSDPTEQARRKKACQPYLDSVRRYEITDAKEGLLKLRPRIDEIASETLTTCAVQPTISGGKSCAQTTDTSRRNFTCERFNPSDYPLRCVQKCTPPVAGSTVVSNECRSGRTCVKFGDDPATSSFCADAPRISDQIDYQGHSDDKDLCPLDQLLAYQVGAGRSFLVHGTAPAVYIPGRAGTNGTCEADPNRLDRIPLFNTSAVAPSAVAATPALGGQLTIPRCDPSLDINLDDVPMPDLDAYFRSLMSNSVDGNGKIAPTIPSPCLVGLYKVSRDERGAPYFNAFTGASLRNYSSYYAIFQNRELRFVLANLEKYLGDFEQIVFDVHGGFQAETVLIPGLIAMDAPARLVLSPIDSQGQSSDLANTQELPFLFVVDQRRLARASLGVSATRGQVLRVYSRKPTTSDANSLLPVYDDPASSANLWPIQ